MTRQWTVKVDGNNVKTLHDGESVEIGRKPLRPLSDDGFARLDIMDPGKSMSKRHAVLSVDKQGNCSVRDLHSTNGSFVVTNNGQLMRLPAGEDIKLPIDSMTLQFGDVRLTLESAFEHDDEDDDATSGVSDDTSQPVSNLFEYAVSDEAPQEPDAADMSVDDILNLRAGEPTTFFHARNVTDRADALHQAERQTFTPEHADKPELEDAFPSVSLVQETVVAADKPRDLFADAAAQAEAEAEIEADVADSADAAATDAEVAAVSTETAARPLEASHDGNKNNLIPVDKLFSARPNTPIAVALPDRNDTGDNTGNVDKADNALTRPPRNRRSPPNNRRWRNSHIGNCRTAARRTAVEADARYAAADGTAGNGDRGRRRRAVPPAKQPIAARTGRNRRIQADLRTGIGIRPCVQRRPRQAGADHRGRRPDLR